VLHHEDGWELGV